MSSFIGAVHGVCYGVAATCDLTHGRSMAAILPAVMRFNLPARPRAFRRMAEILGTEQCGCVGRGARAVASPQWRGFWTASASAHRLRDYGLKARGRSLRIVELSWMQIGDFLESNVVAPSAGRTSSRSSPMRTDAWAFGRRFAQWPISGRHRERDGLPVR